MSDGEVRRSKARNFALAPLVSLPIKRGLETNHCAVNRRIYELRAWIGCFQTIRQNDDGIRPRGQMGKGEVSSYQRNDRANEAKIMLCITIYVTRV